ncbi:ABC transporter permease [Thiomonas sp.]|jgi:simple sugar transport system permease protein|uniref:ABC transporter permease n=1 Tax=Thiomonas sp. TaxID=2047785 RepID=UPI00261C859E|nr:ABC transporter permease [Thiomonas sp.]
MLRRALQWRETGILVAVVLLLAYFQFASRYFLSWENLGVLGQYAAAPAIIAAGEVMVLICGELDLSAGQVYAMAPFVMYFAHRAGAPTLVAVALAILAAGVVGLLNGLITVGLRIPSFVTTLGMLFFINGFNLTISGGFPVQPASHGILALVLGGNALVDIVWAIVIAIVFQAFLTKTRWGLHTLATGGNPVGAAEVGIPIDVVRIGNFVLCSALAGFAGVLDAFRIGSIDPLAGGSQIMFMAIASAVIGGTLLTGGSGTVIGALLGAVALGVLKDGFTILGVSAYTFDMILGAAIVVTMFMNVRLIRMRERGSK